MAHYGIKLTGDENTSYYPWSVVNLDNGAVINSYSHQAVADQIADRMNTGYRSPEYDEVDEVMDADGTRRTADTTALIEYANARS